MNAVRIALVTPSLSSTGNSVTAERWASIYRELGHDVELTQRYDGGSADILVALHARKSADSVAVYRETYPDRPVIVALTGTDLYRDLDVSPAARNTLERASLLVTLEDRGPLALPTRFRERTRVIYQSAVRSASPRHVRTDRFQVCLLAHIREVKDPFRAADAALTLPESSRVHIVHGGAVLDPALGEQARERSAREPRYEWRGPLDRAETESLMLESHVMVLSSKMEGGANVLAEALVNAVPIVATRVPGIVGVLGDDYPGYFDVGDTAELAALLHRAETDPAFYEDLVDAGRARAPLVTPEREKQAWAKLLESLGP